MIPQMHKLSVAIFLTENYDMYAALWLVAVLLDCQHFCIVSSHPLSIASNIHPSNLFATLQQRVPDPFSLSRAPIVGNMELPFGAPSRARQPSLSRQGQRAPNQNQQVLTNADHRAPNENQQVSTNAEELASEELQRVRENEKRVETQKRPHGAPYKFCDQFGCHDCSPAEGTKCCTGFKYDRKANRCRELL